MKIKDDLLHITSFPAKDDGTTAEPEEQTVSRILTSEADASMQSGQAVGSIPMQVVAQSTVAEFAATVRSQCVTCKHFDNPGFLALFRKADHPAAPLQMREAMNSLRAALLQTSNADIQGAHSGMDGDMDVEHAIRSMGFCRALTEMANDYVTVHPLSSCPDEVVSPTSPVGLYQPKDNTAERAADEAFDAIMRRAQGKVE
jgi:DNA-binding transcriptional LysR family regulator